MNVNVKAMAMQILIAEDDPVTRRGMDAVLSEWGYETVLVNDGVAALAALRKPDGPLLAIVDWLMPKMDGVEVCRQLRGDDGNNRYVYLIVLTAKSKTADAVSALDAGADDFVGKPFDLAELRVRIRAGVRIVQLQEKLRDLASHDALTGLLNRRMICETLVLELARANRDGTPLAVMMIDLDHFKQVNDEHGHLAGDEVLCEAAARIKSVLRNVDFVGRYGGEEFLAVLPRCEPNFALEVAERMRAAVSARPIAASETTLGVTTSIGLAIVAARCKLPAEALLHAADQALYRAKDAGRNQVSASRVGELTVPASPLPLNADSAQV